MSIRQPKPELGSVLLVPEPPEADYSDELSEAQVEAMRSAWTQDESSMGPMVHEFKWCA